MKTIVVYLCLATLIFPGCKPKSHDSITDDDQKQGEAFAEQFYTLLKKKDYKKTYNLFGNFFYSKSDTAGLQRIYDSTVVLLGDMIDFKMTMNAIEIRGGNENFTEYRMIYKVKRTKHDSEESICLHKKEDKLEIMYYFVESESLLMEQNRKKIELSTIRE